MEPAPHTTGDPPWLTLWIVARAHEECVPKGKAKHGLGNSHHYQHSISKLLEGHLCTARVRKPTQRPKYKYLRVAELDMKNPFLEVNHWG